MNKTVNFIEAVNSGRRFKRVGYDLYMEVHKTGEVVFSNSLNSVGNNKEFVNARFILEKKPVTITITEGDFDSALDKHDLCVARMEPLKKELGF